jgi:hypothetical protein
MTVNAVKRERKMKRKGGKRRCDVKGSGKMRKERDAKRTCLKEKEKESKMVRVLKI